MKVIQVTPVTVMYRGVPRDANVMIYIDAEAYGKTYMVYALCSFTYSLTPTHMSFRVSPEIAREFADDTERDWFYFDAGISCPEIRISRQELIRSFVAFGLIPNPVPIHEVQYRLMYKINGEWDVRNSILFEDEELLRETYKNESREYTVKAVQVTITELDFKNE